MDSPNQGGGEIGIHPASLAFDLHKRLKLRFSNLSVPQAAEVPLLSLRGNLRTGTVGGRRPVRIRDVFRFLAQELFLDPPKVQADVVAILYSTAPSDFDNLVAAVEGLLGKGVSCLLLAFTHPVKRRLHAGDLPQVKGRRFWVGDVLDLPRFLKLSWLWDKALNGHHAKGSPTAFGRGGFLLYHIISSFGMERFLRQFLARSGTKVLLTGTDVQPETRVAVAVARGMGIPSITIQHGILPGDPENLEYVPAWSDYVAVWGERGLRWFEEAGIEPSRLVVTGCPRFDSYVTLRRVPQTPGAEDEAVVTLLLNPSEPAVRSVMIAEYLEAFRGTPWGLTIRLHPAESKSQFQRLWQDLAPSEVGGRTTISQSEPLQQVLQASDAVVTYDSTAGLEAMLLGKPVVLYGSHLFPTASPYPPWDGISPPTTPAALREALEYVLEEDAGREDVIEAQDRYLHRENHRLDGNASQRLTELVLRVARES